MFMKNYGSCEDTVEEVHKIMFLDLRTANADRNAWNILMSQEAGFNAAVAWCFFAVDSVLWPSPAESSLSLTDTASTVIFSAVIASVVSEIGLGSEPAFTVQGYDFRSPTGMGSRAIRTRTITQDVAMVVTVAFDFLDSDMENVEGAART
ncbi:hypothetical protein M8C21_018095 [Ambrosia artemisiifolia]|uniref:Uncharacterized protein n=1 Tax=Ambrosia artemisiifolia TaxID=4212 RepID=A0AAD5GLF4_AMBAR|nr:hypothetical protein M8C21_018095 [Ambrosia artemisiifolia]